jgi:phosphatidate cytidylyltransferase
MKNLQQRVITALVFGIVMIGGILISPWTLAVLLFVISFFGLKEFYKLFNKEEYLPQAALGILIAQLLFAILVFATMQMFTSYKSLFISIPLISILFITELYRNKLKPFQNIAITLAGMIYITLPMMLLFYIGNGFEINGTYEYHSSLILGFFILVWSSDTGAYFIGSKFGKHKLFERHSPKKSWEGFFGGIFFSLLAALIISRFYDELNTIEWMIVAVIIAVCGTLGDLIESMLKRSVNVKDSGQLLPGHGGILDRFDAMFIAIPFIFYFLVLTGKI